MSKWKLVSMSNPVYFLLLVLKIVASVALPVLFSQLEPTVSLSSKTLMGLCLFIAFSAIELLYFLRKINKDLDRESALWSMEHHIEIVLNNIRAHYREIIKEFYGPDDLFRDYFERAFSELAATCETAAERKELVVRNFHFQRTELLLSSFGGGGGGILRYVWFLGKDEPLFDDKWQHYCQQILKGTADGVIKEVRALLVLRAGVRKDDTVIHKLASFYHSTKGHNYKLIAEEKYAELKRDYCLDAKYIDFGIYGRRYIYLTESYGEVTSGVFCKDVRIIDDYTKFFDIVWRSHSATELPKASLEKVKLVEISALKL